MKIRTGFVANSSSCSFACGIGTIKKENIDNFKKELEKENLYDDIYLLYIDNDYTGASDLDFSREYLWNNDKDIYIECDKNKPTLQIDKIQKDSYIVWFYRDFGFDEHSSIYETIDGYGDFSHYNYDDITIEDAEPQTIKVYDFFEDNKYIDNKDVRTFVGYIG
jgi:hypothetical protein